LKFFTLVNNEIQLIKRHISNLKSKINEEKKSKLKLDSGEPKNTWESFWKNSFSIPNDINLKEIINKHAFHVNEKTFKT